MPAAIPNDQPRTCTRCHCHKPAEEFYLYKGTSRPRGRRAKCKQCEIILGKERRDRNKPALILNPSRQKFYKIPYAGKEAR